MYRDICRRREVTFPVKNASTFETPFFSLKNEQISLDEEYRILTDRSGSICRVLQPQPHFCERPSQNKDEGPWSCPVFLAVQCENLCFSHRQATHQLFV
jgi:hypothetical protein